MTSINWKHFFSSFLLINEKFYSLILIELRQKHRLTTERIFSSRNDDVNNHLIDLFLPFIWTSSLSRKKKKEIQLEQIVVNIDSKFRPN